MSSIILANIDIAPLLDARKFLVNAIKETRNELEKAGAIKAFEICYDLSCKFMRRILAYRGIEVASPRESFRLAGQEKLIKNAEIWFEFIKKKA